MKAAAHFVFYFLIGFSLNSYADKILLTGKPVILIPEANYYRFPSTYSPFNNYHFVDISGDNRVCFLSAQPRLRALDLLRINIVRDGKKFLWYCYSYNPNFFTINY